MSGGTMPEAVRILTLASAAARAAGAVVRETWHSGDIRVNAREHHDVKLVADVAAERTITDMIRAQRPQDGILAEESGADATDRDGVWIVDPLDGTVNFSHGHPHFAVSLAWAWRGRIEVGVIYDPLRDELFSAMRGGGAHCNGRPIKCAGTDSLRDAMIAVGLGRFISGEALCADLVQLANTVQKVRIAGSAALDLAYTACGRLDAYYEQRVFLWDLAAGMLLIEEAGGVVYWWPQPRPHQRSCLAAAKGLAAPLIELLQLTPTTDARTCFDDGAG